MTNAKSISTPLARHFRLSAQSCPTTDEERRHMTQVPYANAVGCLMYAMICTRPDITHVVSVVSKFMTNLWKEHWNTVKLILRYLKRTKDFGISFGSSNGVDELEGFVDADYVGDLNNMRSTTGFIFMLFG